jgi:RNA polymerase sigma-70 factor (ECF subfamily)
MQDVFVNLLKNRDELDEAYPSSLLFRIATNVCLNMIRDKKFEGAIDENTELVAKIADLERSSFLSRTIEKLFGQFQASTRTIAVMHYIDEMTYEEISLEIGLGVPAIKKRIKNLKISVKNLGDDHGTFQS